MDELLAVETSPEWAPLCLTDMDAVLCDHAHCEKKAAVAALSLINSYPQHTVLVRQAAGLAAEELRHFRQVHRRVVARGKTLAHDPGDPYVNALRKLLRHGQQEHFMDRLLVGALVEARSCERLGLLGRALTQAAPSAPAPLRAELAELGQFYADLCAREAGHAQLFVRWARRYLSPPAVATRLAELIDVEARILMAMPLAPRIH